MPAASCVSKVCEAHGRFTLARHDCGSTNDGDIKPGLGVTCSIPAGPMTSRHAAPARSRKIGSNAHRRP